MVVLVEWLRLSFFKVVLHQAFVDLGGYDVVFERDKEECYDYGERPIGSTKSS